MTFRRLGDARYALTIDQVGITIEVDRLRRERHELIGELSVICPLAGAHTITADGLIHLADFNLSSAQTRTTRAKVLRERSEADLDWSTWLETLCVETIRAERQGMPARPLSQYPRRTGDEATWHVHGWHLPRHHPAILFGDGGAMKSYLALFLAGTIAAQGAPVLYADWELDGEDHHARLRALFGEDTPEILYLRCERPLIDEADRIRGEVGRHGIEYAVFDSVGFATPGPPESAEMATSYFRAVRQIGIGGSLHIAHATKATTDGEHSHKPAAFRGLKPFGSVFWHNSARSTWFARRAEEDSRDDSAVVIGLFHQKANTGRLQPSVGLSVSFQPDQTCIAPANLADTSDLSVGLSLRQRITAALKAGPKTIAGLADELDAKKESVERTLYRARTQFVSVSNTPDGIHRWALLHPDKGGIH